MKRNLFQILVALGLCMSAQAGLNDGLLACFPLNGNANDVSGNGHNGLNAGGIWCADRFGNPSGAVLFNGTNYVVVQDFSSMSLSSGLTFSAWVKPNQFNLGSTDGTITITAGVISKPRSTGGTGYRLGFYLAKAEMAAYNGYPYDIFENTNEVTNQWVYIAGTVDANYIRIYVNGVLKQQAVSYGYPYVPAGQPLYIGSEGIVGAGDRSFRGAVDDVRIYGRVLSASEIQQLYGIADIGAAPTPPTVVQTNRTPASREIGTHASGNFKVFTNGFFQTNVTLNPNIKTIVLTHGWNSSSDDWPSTMASQYIAGGISANIVAWDWRDDAKQDRPSTALAKTPAQGNALGTNLLQSLGAGYSQQIHFIGHSLGTLVNAAAANYLHGEAPNNNPPQHLSPSRTQMTLLDEAEIAFEEGKFKTVNPATANLGWIKPLPKSFAHADNYVSVVGELQDNAVNIILTQNSPGLFYSSMTDLWNALTVYHAVPCGWYGDTILNPTGSVMGNIWSFERTNGFASPAAGTCFVQNGSGLALNQISRYAADDMRVKGTAGLAEQVGVYYTLKLIHPAVNAVGDVTANVIETALNDSSPAYQTTPATIGISTYAPATPDFWSPQLILRTHSPVYAWLPLTIPTNTTAMSFDFVFQGDGTAYSFEAALNGTNVFSLPLSLVQTNALMNSGKIDVSAFAGTNVELFLGVVGGTSTNTTVAVSGIRLYSDMPPALQAQPTGNNLVLTWPLSTPGFNLQCSTNLGDTNSWTTLTNIPAIVNLQNSVTNSYSGGAQFYRLKK